MTTKNSKVFGSKEWPPSGPELLAREACQYGVTPRVPWKTHSAACFVAGNGCFLLGRSGAIARRAEVRYDKSMTSAKVALSLPADLLEQAKVEVATGRAKNLSVFVAEALDQRLRRDELNAILDAMDEEHGLPSKAAVTWAKRVLGS